MSVHQIARTLPFLRRFARALVGAPERADALVAATLEALIDGRIGMERSLAEPAALFAAFWHSQAGALDGAAANAAADGHPLERRLQRLAPLDRAVYLLVTMEEFGPAEAGAIVGLDEAAVAAALGRVRLALGGFEPPADHRSGRQIRLPER